jgi:putative heme-binding domain-containing protein
MPISNNYQSRRVLALAISIVFPLLLITVVCARQNTAEQKDKELKNPFTGKAEAVKQGHDLFLLSCAYCHGVDARGAGRGPDLTAGRWIHGSSDGDVFHTITQGVHGTEMPACGCGDEDAWKLVSFVRSLSTNVSNKPVPGDRVKGEKIFFEQAACNSCHMVNDKGSRFGPDLSRIGAARSVRSLTDSIRLPDQDIVPGYEGVTVLTKDNKRINGVRKNEDTFTVQLMDQAERYHLYQKQNLRDVLHEKKSLMPAYPEAALSASDLQDLLAYLDSLRGSPAANASKREEKTVVH